MEELYPNCSALMQIIVIDVVLAGDNAIVVGLAASRVAPELRMRVIVWASLVPSFSASCLLEWQRSFLRSSA